MTPRKSEVSGNALLYMGSSWKSFSQGCAKSRVLKLPAQKNIAPEDNPVLDNYLVHYDASYLLIPNGTDFIAMRKAGFWINASHIVKAAGRGNYELVRFKTRNSEISFDVVRNGEQKYQGTYVDFETGCRLCNMYGLSELQKQLQIETEVDWSYRRCRRWLLSVYHVSASESVVSRREDCTNIHRNVDVRSLAHPLRPDKCKKNLELLDTPAKHLRKYPQTKPTQTFIHATVKIDSSLAKALALWPRAEGHFEGDDVHVDEACFFHLALHNLGVATSGYTHGLDTLFPEPLPLLKGTVRGH